MFDSYPKEGKATYTYKEDNNKERIYQGSFKYTDRKNTFSGNFNNNIQDGTWTHIVKNDTYNIKTTITYNNGVVSGPLVIEKIYTKVGKQTVLFFTVDVNKGHKIGEKSTLFKATIKDNKIVGPISYTPCNEIEDGILSNFDKEYPVKGSFDEYGNPDGKWFTYNSTTQTIENYQEDGSINCSKQSTATGDYLSNDRGPYMADYAIILVNRLIGKYSFRDTPKTGVPEIDYTDIAKNSFRRLPYKYSIIEIEYDKSKNPDIPDELVKAICEYILNYKSISNRVLFIDISMDGDKIVDVDGYKNESALEEYLYRYNQNGNIIRSYHYPNNYKHYKLTIRFISPYEEDITGLTSHYVIKDSELDAERAQLEKWENEGFPVFSDFSKDEHLTPVSLTCNPNYIKSDLNDYEEYIMPYRKYDDRINYKNENGFGTSYLYFNVDRDGVITNEKVSGPLSKVLKPSKYFSVNKPASYHFERLDSTISVPCSVKIPIEEVGLKIADGWIDLKYNKKKNTWKVKSLNDIYIPKDLIPTIEEYFQFIPEDMDDGVNYREGKHRLHIGVFKHKAIVAEENEIDLNPVVIIFSK